MPKLGSPTPTTLDQSRSSIRGRAIMTSRDVDFSENENRPSSDHSDASSYSVQYDKNNCNNNHDTAASAIVADNPRTNRLNPQGSKANLSKRLNRTQNELLAIRKKGLAVRYNRQFTDLVTEQTKLQNELSEFEAALAEMRAQRLLLNNNNNTKKSSSVSTTIDDNNFQSYNDLLAKENLLRNQLAKNNEKMVNLIAVQQRSNVDGDVLIYEEEIKSMEEAIRKGRLEGEEEELSSIETKSLSHSNTDDANTVQDHETIASMRDANESVNANVNVNVNANANTIAVKEEDDATTMVSVSDYTRPKSSRRTNAASIASVSESLTPSQRRQLRKRRMQRRQKRDRRRYAVLTIFLLCVFGGLYWRKWNSNQLKLEEEAWEQDQYMRQQEEKELEVLRLIREEEEKIKKKEEVRIIYEKKRKEEFERKEQARLNKLAEKQRKLEALKLQKEKAAEEKKRRAEEVEEQRKQQQLNLLASKQKALEEQQQKLRALEAERIAEEQRKRIAKEEADILKRRLEDQRKAEKARLEAQRIKEEEEKLAAAELIKAHKLLAEAQRIADEAEQIKADYEAKIREDERKKREKEIMEEQHLLAEIQHQQKEERKRLNEQRLQTAYAAVLTSDFSLAHESSDPIILKKCKIWDIRCMHNRSRIQFKELEKEMDHYRHIVHLDVQQKEEQAIQEYFGFVGGIRVF